MKAEYMYHSGNDLAVVNAARVSFDKVSYELDTSDEKLISYLARHNHWTPFAHNSITLRMQAPVPIRTQCFKHKFGFVENEESRRYIFSDVEVYEPEIIRSAPTDGAKQGSGGKHKHSEQIKAYLLDNMLRSVEAYENLIDAKVCPEQARFVLPQGAEVNWVWTGSLAAFARFYALRNDGHAQYEVRILAEEVGKLIEPLFPISWKALTERK